MIGVEEASEERAAAGLEANNEVTDEKEEDKRKLKEDVMVVMTVTVGVGLQF